MFIFLFTGFLSSPSPALSAEGGAHTGTFRKGASHFGAGLSVGKGLNIWGTIEDHDLAFGWIGLGKVLTREIADDHWYEGNMEFWGELFAGLQYNGEQEYLSGFTPFLRYNFTKGERIVPFFDFGAGVSLTGIDEPDLCGDFQFNLSGGIGAHYLVREDRAFTFQARIFHFSNAGLRHPNRGVNSLQFNLGYNWFF